MKNRIHILLLSALLFAFGCAKPEGKSDAKFKIGLAALADINAVGAGGAMLWGRSDKGDMFGSVITPGSGFELSLVNGQWTFWSVAWEGDGSGASFTGSIRCAKNAATLNGTDIQVSMSLSNAKCDLPDFTPSVAVNAGLKQFPDIATHECQKITDHNGISCGKGVAAAKTASRRFVLSSFIKPSAGVFQALPGRLVSQCKATGVPFTTEHLPLGNGVLPAMTFLESFYSSNTCDENDPKGYRRAVYEFGLMGTAKLDTIKFVNEGSCNATGFTNTACTEYNGMWTSGCSLSSNQYDISRNACETNGGTYTTLSNKKSIQLITSIPDGEVCSGVRMNPSNNTPFSFASGNGTMSAPYTICREYQFNAISETSAAASANSSAHFSLQADLDMNRTSIIGSGDQPVPTCLSNKPGANIIPIGGLYNGSCNIDSPVVFNGSFNGNGHTISNIRIQEDDADDVGLIRLGGTISNIILKHVDIEGRNYVAAVSGRSASAITNVHVVDAEIRGNSNIAAIAGKSTVMEMENLHAVQTRLESDAQTGAVIGGLISETDSGSLTLKKSSFEGMIRTHATAEIIGGLIGKGTSGINIYLKESFSNGVILSSASSGAYAGGLVGNVSGFLTVDDSYSQMSIAHSSYGPTNEGGKVGGLAGYVTSTSTFNNSFYYGSIMLPCFKDATTYCYVGNILGSGTPTGSNYAGSLLAPNWYATLPADNQALNSIEDGTLKATLISGGKFKDVGTPLPKLSWEISPCALNVNNAGVGVQAAVGRGQVATNPIILCNKEQWKQIAANQGLFYSLGGNLALGDIGINDMPSNFTGSLEGNHFLLSGFRSYVTTGSGGLFKVNSGKIANVDFAAGAINAVGTAQNVAIVGSNAATTGVMIRNTFQGLYINGASTKMAVIAGENSGSISLSKVDAFKIESNATGVGAMVALNTASGSIVGVRANGMINLSNPSSDLIVGGLVGKNLGIIQEVDSGVNVYNSTNTSANTYIGGLVGINEAIVKDALIRPYVSLSSADNNPKTGHVFGQTTSTSQVSRVVATNEMMKDNGVTPYGSHFVATHTAGATYNNSFALTGAVYTFDTTMPLSVSNCSETAGTFTYTMAAAFNTDVTFPDGYMLTSSSGGDRISRRITGAHTDATDTLDSTSGVHFTIPCGTGLMTAGATLNSVKSALDFAATGVTNIRPEGFSALTTFCPSASAEAGNGTYKCNASEFDIVEDEIGGIGFERLKAAYSAMVNGQPMPANRPVWTLEEDRFPRLFLAD
ncbi:hypothetical protein DOM21_09520 [Bacteriovorax stolpii]|uniref:hypothetical protein n=1 Tax=Bacteriovorax stolpii TaxID=960 RepID=UPI001158CFFB|nr:hypothetical protein [Bacteriovorax stolpii]QDK41685.1 hypothetical protein DOM21_09520 [Bacteriovorax stolpii]